VNQAPFTITFLGTGTSSGVPMIGCSCPVCTSTDPHDNRLRCSILIETAQTTLVIDATPDFRYQMLRAGVKKLDGIVFTHPHKDHIAGLDDVRAFNFFYKKAMPLYVNDVTLPRLLKEYDYAFADEKYDGVPLLEIEKIDTRPFTVGDITLQPILVWHYRMPVLGFRIGDFTYITDANRIDPPEMQKIHGSHTIVLNALRREPHLSHFTLSQAVEIAQELKPVHAWFTHMSHQLGRHEDINAELPPGIALAYDGLKLSFT
jgi:phosphoribosyl 1,2-cyclic phosphate phosphodiesterase